MTPEQWDSIQSDLSAIKILLFALAKTSPDTVALHAAFQAEKETLGTALLHTQLSEAAIELYHRQISEIEKVIWG